MINFKKEKQLEKDLDRQHDLNVLISYQIAKIIKLKQYKKRVQAQQLLSGLLAQQRVHCENINKLLDNKK